MSSRGRERDDVDSLPPSCKYVLKVLECHGNRMTRQELLEETNLAPSTLDDALRTLESRQCILKMRKSNDPNQVVAELRQSL